MSNVFTEALTKIGHAGSEMAQDAYHGAGLTGIRGMRAYEEGGFKNLARGINNNVSATGYGAMAGAGYGMFADDTSMVGGAFMGAGMGYTGRKLKNSYF